MAFWNDLLRLETELGRSVATLLTFLALAAVIHFVWIAAASQLKGVRAHIRTLLKPLRTLIEFGLVLIGLNLGLNGLTYVQDREHLRNAVPQALTILWILLACWTAVRMTNTWVSVRSQQQVELTSEVRDRFSLFRKLGVGLICVLGGIMIVRTLGADISPLLAGGAVGGLVLGLALQESLGNVFSGLFLNADSSIRIGDLIKLENGVEGFVEEIGWRNTKIRRWDQTLYIIPNGVFGKISFTNLIYPTAETTIMIDVGISYSSDLDHVERVVLDVAKGVQAEHGPEELNPPAIRWRDFLDSSIQFRVFIPIRDPEIQYMARSMFIKNIHQAFRIEGIEIPFPIVTLPEFQKPISVATGESGERSRSSSPMPE